VFRGLLPFFPHLDFLRLNGPTAQYQQEVLGYYPGNMSSGFETGSLIPWICSAFEWLKYHLAEEKEVHHLLASFDFPNNHYY